MHMILKIMAFCRVCLVRPFIKKKIPKFVRLNAEKFFICFLYFVLFYVIFICFWFFGGTLPFFHLEPFGSMFTRHLKIHSLLAFWLFCNDLVVEMRVNCSLGNLDPLVIYLAFD